MNEWYARDCSRKVKSAFRTKALNGEFTAGRPAFGYQRDPNDSHHLIPDCNAPIVKRMFRMALEGETVYRIAKALEADEILTPRAYLAREFGVFKTEIAERHPFAWSNHTVSKILQNPVYLGNMVSQRYGTKSYKDKRMVYKPEDEWIIVKNTHEALVDQVTFDTVQARLNVKQPLKWAGTSNKFRGLMICGGCQTRMSFDSRAYSGFRCTKSRRFGNTECSTHYISKKQVETLVLGDIRTHASLAATDKDKYVEYLVHLSEREMDGEKASYQKEAAKCQRRASELDAILKKLYEDRVFGVISDDRYAAMSADYEGELKEQNERYSELQNLLSTFAKRSRDAKDFADLVEQFTDITELTSELLHTLIEKIVVHEKEVVDGEVVMRVEIHYRFIGKVGNADGKDLKVHRNHGCVKYPVSAGTSPA